MNEAIESTVCFNDPSSDRAAYRREQAEIDADIEGLAYDVTAARLMDQLRDAGLPIEERLLRLGTYLRHQDSELPSTAGE